MGFDSSTTIVFLGLLLLAGFCTVSALVGLLLHPQATFSAPLLLSFSTGCERCVLEVAGGLKLCPTGQFGDFRMTDLTTELIVAGILNYATCYGCC